LRKPKFFRQPMQEPVRRHAQTSPTVSKPLRLVGEQWVSHFPQEDFNSEELAAIEPRV
jgi:hypothetical protein